MRKRSSLLLLILGVLMAAAAVGQEAAAPKPAEEKPQVIAMTAKRYEYNPSEIHVKKGVKVQLKIRALDHTHGFKIDLYPEGSDKKGAPGLVFSPPQDNWKLEQGQERVIDFVAEQTGTYSFRCSNFCGWHHRSMKGKLVVEP